LRNTKQKQQIFEQEEKIVIEALEKLNGQLKMPVMSFRKMLSIPLGETHIKNCFARLIEQGKLIKLDERCHSHGRCYQLVNK
jgi:hypothetical protein